MNILTSALGWYRPQGNPEKADCIIGHSFGTSVGRGSVNAELAQFILKHAQKRPIIVDRTLAEAFPDRGKDVAKIIEGEITNSLGVGIGSWGTLVEAQAYMNERGYSQPLMVAQAFHIGRVAMQAEKLGMTSVIPDNLPRSFDVQSDQVWTRSLFLWVPREVVGSLALRVQGKL